MENQLCISEKNGALVPVMVASLKQLGYKVRTAKSRKSTQVFYKLKRKV